MATGSGRMSGIYDDTPILRDSGARAEPKGGLSPRAHSDKTPSKPRYRFTPTLSDPRTATRMVATARSFRVRPSAWICLEHPNVGFGSYCNVRLVFKPAPNVVYCSWPLLFVNVVQLLFRPKFGQNGCFRLKFCSRRLCALAAHKPKFFDSRLTKLKVRWEIFLLHDALLDQSQSKSDRFGPGFSKLGSLGVSRGLRRPYCSTKSLTLGYCCS